MIAGLSISFPAVRCSEAMQSSYVNMLHQAARNLSRSAGLSQLSFLTQKGLPPALYYGLIVDDFTAFLQ